MTWSFFLVHKKQNNVKSICCWIVVKSIVLVCDVGLHTALGNTFDWVSYDAQNTRRTLLIGCVFHRNTAYVITVNIGHTQQCLLIATAKVDCESWPIVGSIWYYSISFFVTMNNEHAPSILCRLHSHIDGFAQDCSYCSLALNHRYKVLMTQEPMLSTDWPRKANKCERLLNGWLKLTQLGSFLFHIKFWPLIITATVTPTFDKLPHISCQSGCMLCKALHVKHAHILINNLIRSLLICVTVPDINNCVTFSSNTNWTIHPAMITGSEAIHQKGVRHKYDQHQDYNKRHAPSTNISVKMWYTQFARRHRVHIRLQQRWIVAIFPCMNPN